MHWTQTTPPDTTPVSLTEAKLHLRVDHTAEDDLITALIAAAVEQAETRLRRQLITAAWRATLPGFPACGWIELPRPPLQSITSITYVDADGDTQTLASSVYDVDANSHPGRVLLAYDQSWPTVRDRLADPVTITYSAGYGDDAADVPANYRQAILYLVAHYYRFREPVLSGAGVVSIPLTVDALLSDRCLMF